MRAAELPDFVEIFERVALVFGKRSSEELVGVYFDALRDVALEVVRQRAEHAIANMKFFPKPAELRPPRLERPEMPTDPVREAQFRALLAEHAKNWRERIRRDGPIARLRFIDALLARRLMLAQSEAARDDDLDEARRQFDDAASALTDREIGNDPHVVSLARQIFGEPRARRYLDAARTNP